MVFDDVIKNISKHKQKLNENFQLPVKAEKTFTKEWLQNKSEYSRTLKFKNPRKQIPYFLYTISQCLFDLGSPFYNISVDIDSIDFIIGSNKIGYTGLEFDAIECVNEIYEDCLYTYNTEKENEENYV
jgi:hypothetical protein